MKITVFGGSGFLGSHVCDKLTEAGHQVRVFDLTPSPWLSQGQEMIVGDILDEEAVNTAVQGADAVFNFAGIADIDDANVRPKETVRINILGNTIVLDACVKAKVKRYVFASTVYVFSKSGGFYRCSKQACEQYIDTYRENYGLDYTILRYGSLYGPRADEKNAIHRFVRQALEEGKISYYGSPEALREYVHVEDAARSSVQILEPQYANEHIVLTGPQPMRVGDLMRMIKEMLNMDLDFEWGTGGSAHYEITPYTFNPTIGKKLSAPLHVDLGQGVLRVIEELHETLHPELHNHLGVLVKNGNNKK
jgi:UDP-glucose 4-epimerase